MVMLDPNYPKPLTDGDENESYYTGNPDDISEEDLEVEVDKFLENADLEVVTMKMVVEKLEDSFQTNLTSKKPLIRQLVKEFLNSIPPQNQDLENWKIASLKF